MSIGQGFAIWLTGLPASGKSSITRVLVNKLALRGVSVVVLASDEMRTILTPEPTYSLKERDVFYLALTQIGELITRNGVNVIFDATANRRTYREYARTRIPRFREVFVRCPLEVCMQRDPKGIYRRAATGNAGTLPGIQSIYEPPLNADITLDGQEAPEESANEVIEGLHHFLTI
jgi:adenylylsulfate kinase